MTTGRPPINPCPDREPPVVNGLGAGERRLEKAVDDGEFLCNVCSDQDAIFGIEDSTGEELRASEEGEQAAQRLRLCPPPFNPHSGSLWAIVSRSSRTGQGARIAWKAEGESLATAES